MKTIIAPTDFSDVSLNAVNYAGDMAASLNAELILAHIADNSVAASNVSYEEPPSVEQLKLLREKLYSRNKNAMTIRIENLSGEVLDEMEKLCDREKPFAIVMATHGASAFKHIFFLKSVTLFAAKNMKYPVWIIPPNASYIAINNIGIACDLEDIYKEPLESLRELISTFHASLHVLHVKNQEGNDHFAEMMLTRHHLKEFRPILHYIESADIEEGIFSFVQQNAIDLLIIKPKENSSIEKSKLKEFVFHTQIPLMSLQPL